AMGAWTPIAATETTSGYQVAWQATGTDQYTVWNTDLSGNFLSYSGVISGDSSMLEGYESAFRQDLNDDGTIGVKSTVVEAAGATAFYQVADEYALGSPSGPTLKFFGPPVVVGDRGAWAPIGAEQTANGYEVAWKDGEQYTVWSTDRAGNFQS